MKINFQLFFEKLGCKGPFLVAILLFVGCVFLSAIIPPLKSPDEHDHVERAYHLSKGMLSLHAPDGKPSGGNVDIGLLRYLESYQPNQAQLTAEEVEAAVGIRWAGETKFEPAPGTGYYFPLIYLPQAGAIWIGKSLNLTIDKTYRMARLFNLIAIVTLLYIAFVIYPPSPIILALLIMPMTLFQMSSATIDGLATALTIFSVSLFLKMRGDYSGPTSALSIAMATAIVILVSSRIHAIPILALLLANFYFSRSRLVLILFITAGIFVAGWTAYALSNVSDGRVLMGETTSNIIRYYLTQPTLFFSLLWQTVCDEHWRYFYFKSFIGILGWLDAEFDEHVYIIFGIFTTIMFLLSVSLARLRYQWAERSLIAGIAIASLLITFFAMLVTWTPHPAAYILGVQGRYFLIPLVLFTYAISDVSCYTSGFRIYITPIAILLVYLLSMVLTTELMIKRYYMIEYNTYQEEILFRPSFSDEKQINKATMPLSSNRSIELRLPATDKYNLGKIARIEILFGTHMRNNPGEGELVLRSVGGEYRVKFSLSGLLDNRYKIFSVPPDFYTSGEILYATGGGVSVWELHSGESDIFSCVRMRTIQNQMFSIAGCP